MKVHMGPQAPSADGIPTHGDADLARGRASTGDRRAKNAVHRLGCAWAAGTVLLFLGAAPCPAADHDSGSSQAKPQSETSQSIPADPQMWEISFVK
jgi:hypothetical protein